METSSINLDFKRTQNYFNYVKYAKRYPNYWHALFVNEINKRVSRSGENFKIIVQDPDDHSYYYSIPFAVVKPLLLDMYIDYSNVNSGRWVLTIRDGDLCLNGTPLRTDVTRFFRNPDGLYPKVKSEVTIPKIDLTDLLIRSYLDSQQDENDTNEDFFEGGKKFAFRGYYERNPDLRIAAVKYHGTTCKVCGCNFEKMYGDLGKSYIEVHHLKPVNTLKNATAINPISDMTVLCANCHRMIHRDQKNVLTVEQLKSLLKMKFP